MDIIEAVPWDVYRSKGLPDHRSMYMYVSYGVVGCREAD